jgi:hypothetical protein
MSRKILSLAALLTLGLNACEEERADINSPDFDSAYGFTLSPLQSNLPRGGVRFVPTGTEAVTVTLAGLDSLSSGVYTAWLGDSLGANFTKVTGALTSVRVDTTFDTDGNPVPNPVSIPLGNQSSFSNGGPNQTFTWVFDRATSGVGAGAMQHFVLSIEDNAGATTIGERRPLFARRADVALASGAHQPRLRFGNYGPTAATEYLFASAVFAPFTGVTQVPPIRGRGFFRGPVLQVTDSLMARPPRGYYYAMYAYKRARGTTVGDTLYLGEQRSPFPNRALSQFDADVSITDPENVFDTPRAIIAGQTRISVDTVPGFAAEFPYKDYFEVWVTVQPKASERGRMGPGRLAFGVIPTPINLGTRQ